MCIRPPQLVKTSFSNTLVKRVGNSSTWVQLLNITVLDGSRGGGVAGMRGPELAESELSHKCGMEEKVDIILTRFFSNVFTVCQSACLLASLVPFEGCIFF